MKFSLRTTRAVMALSIAFGLMVVILDTIIDSIFFEHSPIMDSLLFDVSAFEIYMRLTVFMSFIIFGVIISKIMRGSVKTQAALKEREERLNAVIINAPIGIATSDEHRRFVSANREFCKTLGYTEDELTGMSFKDITHPEDMQGSVALMEALDEGRVQSFSQEKRYLKKDGHAINGRVTVSALRGGSGRPYLYIAQLEDVTERRRAEEALRESEEQFRNLVENLPVGIAITSLSGQLLVINKALQKMRGYDSREELMQAVLSERYYDPKDRERWLTLVKEKGRVEGFEIRLKRKDGSLFWASFNSIMQKTASDEQHIINVIQDITERRQAEEKFRVSEERYLRLIEDAPIGIVLSTASGRIIDANGALVRMQGYDSKEEFIMSPVSERYYDLKDRDQWQKLIREQGKIEEFEIQLKHKDGTAFWASYNTLPHRSTSSEEQQFITVVQDITKRKQAEEMFKGLATSSPVGIFIVQNGKFVYTNPQFRKDSGYSESELSGMESLNIVLPEDRELVRENAVQMLKGNRTNPYEYRLVTKKGEVGWSSETVASIEYRGERASLGSYQNITERKKAEETLRLQAELLDLESDSVDLHDYEGNILYANSAFYSTLGYTREELPKVTLTQLDDEESAKLIPTKTKELSERGKATFTVNHRHKNGSWIPMEVHASLIEIGGKQMVMSVAHDISEQRKLQQQLMAQDRLASIGQLVSGIAHEINNPLTSVIGFSDLLLQKDLPDDIAADLKIVNDQAIRTATIVRNLLTFARIKQPEGKGPVDINEILERTLTMRAHEQQVNNIHLATNFATLQPKAVGNASELQQVFFNLIINAEQAMLDAHAKGNLTVTTERTEDMVRASIADDGPGISSEHMSRLFTPFFTTKEVGKGTGLGLSICHGIITGHGGRIYVTSEPGKGATFIVELPAYIEEYSS